MCLLFVLKFLKYYNYLDIFRDYYHKIITMSNDFKESLVTKSKQ